MLRNRPECQPSSPPLSDQYRRLAALLLIVGLGCRTALYLLNHPLYMDEAFVALNLLDRDFVGLTGHLDELQVAPVLFLWAERAAYLALGPSEWSLRLIPFLAGAAALGLFWRLARNVVSPPAAAIAVGLLATSRWPLHMASQVKPYSLDLLAAVGLLTLAIHAIRQPGQTRWLLLLVLVVPLAVASSYPAVFVGAGVGVVLLPVVWRRPGWAPRLLFAAYGVLLVAGFLVCDVLIGRQQLGPPGDRLHDYMMEYWKRAFPPHDPVALGKWLVTVHFGPLTGYPYGNGDAAGAVAFPLLLVGAWVCWRRGERHLLALLLLPFALTLVAALLGKYPYGGCTRLSQHLAPAVCLLAGVGAARVCELIVRCPVRRCRAVSAIAALLAAFGVVLVTYWFFRPYRDDGDLGAKRLATAVMSHARPGDRVLYTPLPESVRAGTVWYLRVNHARPAPLEERAWAEALHSAEPVWLLMPAGEAGRPRPGPGIARPATGMPALKLEHRATFELPDSSQAGRTLRVELWEVGPAEPGAAADRGRMVAFPDS